MSRHWIKQFLSAIFLMALFGAVACSRTTQNTIPEASSIQSGPDLKGQEISGGGGETIYMSAEETEKHMRLTYEFLMGNDAWVLKYLLQSLIWRASSLDWVDLTKEYHWGSDLEKAHEATFSKYFSISQDSLVEKQQLSSPQTLKILEESAFLGQLSVEFHDCSENSVQYQPHQAFYDKENRRLCFDSSKIQLEKESFLSQAASLVLHELIHIEQDFRGLGDYRSEAMESEADTMQKIFFSYLELKETKNPLNTSHDRFVHLVKEFKRRKPTLCKNEADFFYIQGYVSSFSYSNSVFSRYSIEDLFLIYELGFPVEEIVSARNQFLYNIAILVAATGIELQKESAPETDFCIFPSFRKDFLSKDPEKNKEIIERWHERVDRLIEKLELIYKI